MIFTDECMLMCTVVTRYLGLQVWTEQNTEINLHLNNLHLECNDNKRQKTSWKKYQMTESWRKLTIFERENLQYLLSIKYVEKHNGKNYTVGKHKERTTQDVLLLQIYLKKESVIKPETQLLRGLRNRRFLDRVGFLTTLGVGFIYLTPELQLNHFLHHTLPNSCLLKNDTISFETFMETENSCCVPRFPLIASCYRIVDSQTSFTFLQSRESEILERSVSGILPPTPQPWLLPRISYYFKRLNWTKSLQEVSFFFDNIVLNLC